MYIRSRCASVQRIHLVVVVPRALLEELERGVEALRPFIRGVPPVAVVVVIESLQQILGGEVKALCVVVLVATPVTARCCQRKTLEMELRRRLRVDLRIHCNLTSNCKINGHFSKQNHHSSGAILH